MIRCYPVAGPEPWNLKGCSPHSAQREHRAAAVTQDISLNLQTLDVLVPLISAVIGGTAVAVVNHLIDFFKRREERRRTSKQRQLDAISDFLVDFRLTVGGIQMRQTAPYGVQEKSFEVLSNSSQRPWEKKNDPNDPIYKFAEENAKNAEEISIAWERMFIQQQNPKVIEQAEKIPEYLLSKIPADRIPTKMRYIVNAQYPLDSTLFDLAKDLRKVAMKELGAAKIPRKS